ncbi:alpha/beta hydrolase [Pigmentiphaga kullae]|uniref:Acetyl esterase n=1 Tax=Pigmentiphaga kullae TaxID=151784 RepID=A0A4Q7NE22_9BURK|nr:alpha/beta hydrolase [Pigmentiphaga kullae]RZS81351.1 acetyl esterase [Pigmentiphaga kullae]
MTAAPLPVLDPLIAAELARLKAAGCAQADPTVLPLAEARAQQDRYFAAINARLPPIASTRDLTVAGAQGDMRARLYRPAICRDDAFVVFVRGAGWWAGGLDSHEAVCRGIANATSRSVVALDYRRSPEHVFPAQRDDVVAGVEWLLDHANDLDLPARAVLWGESAGASLCVLTWRRLADAGRAAALPCLILFYGNLGGPRENLRPQSKWVWQQYLGPAWPHPPDSVVPAKTGLHDFPPVWLGVGDADPLIEDSRMFAGRLAGMNRQHELTVYPGMPHGFSGYAESVPMAAGAARDAAVFMGRALGGVSGPLQRQPDTKAEGESLFT